MSNQLQQIISDTQTSLRSNPERGKTIFNSRSALKEGFHSEVNLRQHQITVDEPPTLGGTDQGPNPVELILAALGTCQEITYRAYATALGIPLESVSVELEGELDLRGFFAVSDQVRAGYQQIKGTVRLQSSASAEKLQQLRDVVNAHCPVLDILTNPVPVKLDLRIVHN
jgi:uncharacterized OsmC-like protein